jgi:hypothetical protein
MILLVGVHILGVILVNSQFLHGTPEVLTGIECNKLRVFIAGTVLIKLKALMDL